MARDIEYSCWAIIQNGLKMCGLRQVDVALVSRLGEARPLTAPDYLSADLQGDFHLTTIIKPTPTWFNLGQIVYPSYQHPEHPSDFHRGEVFRVLQEMSY